MKQPTTIINGTEYVLDTTLRVAYQAQGANNHKPYAEVFQTIGDMMLEKQIEILYLAFRIANPEIAKEFTQMMFLNYYLEHYNLKEVMEQLQGVIKGVLGEDDDKAEVSQEVGNQGN